ncbi:hypothetical protein PQ743_05000 [Thermoanaerobacterium thermosaccharolyticum]|uniref:hypothetical protein n=1 Tax=Thermoanaerobacterium TaxID=28895 RepID=UPI0026DF9BBF|nr:hypothetical protein [Thermoanaerobacterium sp. CMT5567-10]WKV08576.1 hypothetical protein Q2T46_13745 [Thermoanaerobacterium sp. CMT5567-10]
MSINSEFNRYIKEYLALSQKDITTKVKSREWLINNIIRKIKEKSDCPQLYKENGQKYLTFGSYFKGTKVSDVDEFDIMLIVDSNGGVFKQGGIQTGEGIGIIDPNPKYFQKYRKDNDPESVSPRKIMNWLKDIIDEVLEPYGCEPGEKNGQAITAYIKSKDISIDFVPGGIFRKVGSNEIFYTIPKGDADGGWIITNPRVDKEIVNQTGSKYKQFKNSIRLFKYIFKESYNVKISSYAVESAHIDFERKNYFYDDYKYDFINILNHFITLVQNKKIPDMRDNSINLISDINYDACLQKLNRIKERFLDLDENSVILKTDVDAFLRNE